MTDDNTNSRMRSIRIRKRLDAWAIPIVVALLLLGGLGAWVAYDTHTNPSMETEEQTVSTWEEQASLSHAAEVQQPNPVFDFGQTLSNQPVYFTQLAPEFEGTYEYTYTASESGNLDVEVDVSLRMQSVDDDGNPYWRVTESLEQVERESVSPGETVTTAVELNATDVAAELDGIQENIGSTVGTTEVAVVFDTQVSGVVNDENFANAHQSSLFLEPGGATYSVETDGATTESHEATETVESEQTPGTLRAYGPFALILGSVLGLVGLAGAKYRGRIPPSPAERAALEQYQQRQEFDDWISKGAVPAWERTGTEIEVESLEDLVDVAIDTNERVIEDTNTGDFIVPRESRYYTYTTSVGVLGPDEREPTEPTQDRAAEETDAREEEEALTLVENVESEAQHADDGAGEQLTDHDQTTTDAEQPADPDQTTTDAEGENGDGDGDGDEDSDDGWSVFGTGR